MNKIVDVSYGKDEEKDFYSNDDLYNISSWGADLSFREIVTRYTEGEIIKPQLQRNYVWDKSEASRFIDSILMGLPVPSIFLAKVADEQLLIIDGYQRIMTVYDYIRGIFSGDGKTFSLTNSEKINSRWRGKAFAELTEIEQRKIRGTTIHCIIFVQTAPKDNDTSMYQIFERINTSGRTLMPQEIRNCVYYGPFNDALMEMNKDHAWRKLYGSQIPDSRMRDIELILRFFALREIYQNSEMISTKRISLKKELNEFMGKLKDANESFIEECKHEFSRTMQTILEKFGEDAFRNLSDKQDFATDALIDKPSLAKISNKFNAPIFDSLSIAVSTSGKIAASSNEARRGRIRLLIDKNYEDLLRNRTTVVERIKARVNIAKSILD